MCNQLIWVPSPSWSLPAVIAELLIALLLWSWPCLHDWWTTFPVTTSIHVVPLTWCSSCLVHQRCLNAFCWQQFLLDTSIPLPFVGLLNKTSPKIILGNLFWWSMSSLILFLIVFCGKLLNCFAILLLNKITDGFINFFKQLLSGPDELYRFPLSF